MRLHKSVVEICVGDEIQYRGIVHGSVGIHYFLEYDIPAFKEHKVLSYTEPDIAHLPGGDEQEVVYTLTALKSGRYVIVEIDDFRGEKTVRRENIVVVKDLHRKCS